MLRKWLVNRQLGQQPHFRWRSGEVSRIEAFSDAVFAFAVTLLVVSLEVPQTFDELLATMRGFVAFAICFVMLVSVWSWHYHYFRRYGLQDGFTMTMNAIVLFVVLFYVYPLKFLFTLAVASLVGLSDTVTLPNGSVVPRIEAAQTPALMVIYGAGFLAVVVTFAILYTHAYRQRTALALTPAEVMVTRGSIERFILMGTVAVLSSVIAIAGGPGHVGLAGFTYILIWPITATHARWTVGRVLQAQQAGEGGNVSERASDSSGSARAD